MDNTTKQKIINLRKSGLGYTKISQILNMSVNTVKSFCRRNNITITDISQNTEFCRQCGKPVTTLPGHKEKKFCSDVCRMKWWKENPSKIKRKAFYSFVCPTCGKTFNAYGNSHRKYYSHSCYISDRFGGNYNEQ